MSYPVFVYNVLLIAVYILMAAIFFYLCKSRKSPLSFWCMILFGLAFFDNAIFFMKEVFVQIGNSEGFLQQMHWISEMTLLCVFPLIIRMIIGHYIDDLPQKKEIIALVIGSAIIAGITLWPHSINSPLSVLPTVLYVWVFLRALVKTVSRQIGVCILVLLMLYVLNVAFVVSGAVDSVMWGYRNFVIEVYWALYLAFGIGMASALLRTAEETYTPDESVIFKQFLDKYGISVREGDIAKLLMEGATNQDISNQLFLAVGTVKAHNSHIYQKLRITHRTQVLIKYTEYLEERAKR